MGHREEERVVLVGTDQRITSGPAAKTAALKGLIHGCTRTLRSYVRFLLHRGRRPYMAQQAVVYYAWCFDDGLDEYCYWYPADDVIVDASWVLYVG